MELVLTLGVVAVTIPAILGLLGIGFASEKCASDDTTLTAMTSVVVAQLRGNAEISSTTETIADSPYCFDNQGTLLAKSAPGTIYSCQVSLRHPEETELPDVGAHFSILTLAFTWPAGAPPESQNKKVIHVTLPR